MKQNFERFLFEIFADIDKNILIHKRNESIFIENISYG